MNIQSTFFYKRNGLLSSIRNTFPMGNSEMSTNTYIGSSRGGITTKSPAFTSRISNSGENLALGLSLGKHTVYTGKNGKQRDHIVSF